MTKRNLPIYYSEGMRGHMSTNGASFKNRRKNQEEEAAVEASSILSASSSDKYLIKASKPGLGKK